MKILIVLTSHDQLGNTGKKTGFWLEEFAAPYYVLKDAGAEITLASPQGGQPPLDPTSELPENLSELTERYRNDKDAQAQLATTKKLADVSADDFDAVFYPGGHGPMWDLPDNGASIALIEAFVKADKPVAAVCHAPASLVNVRGKDGEYLVRGKRVTGFTNAEEEAVGLTEVVPFLSDVALQRLKGHLDMRDKFCFAGIKGGQLQQHRRCCQHLDVDWLRERYHIKVLTAATVLSAP
ncbi:MAG: type 1 glutamine amidotransferase domain-containing protein [Candidatus Krumholzibacteriia bacterium]